MGRRGKLSGALTLTAAIVLTAAPATACRDDDASPSPCFRGGALVQGGSLHAFAFDEVYGLVGARAHAGAQLGPLGLIVVPSASLFLSRDGAGASLDLGLVADFTIADRFRVGGGPDLGGVTGGSSKAGGIFYGGRVVLGGYPWVSDDAGRSVHRFSVGAEVRFLASSVSGSALSVSPLAIVGWEYF